MTKKLRPSSLFCTAGFTLVELLVVISILVILGVVAYANFVSLEKDQSLQRSAINIDSMLSSAFTNAKSGIKCDDGNPTTGWSVTFRTDRQSLQLNCYWKNPTTGVESVVSRPVALIDTNPKVQIDTITPTSGSVCNITYPVATFTIRYAPIFEGAQFLDGTGVLGCSSITLNLKNTSVSLDNTKSVVVNNRGSVQIQ
jgi:prepilin-type N-terminal cleavage/methylation domain-containing protein